MEDGPVTRPMCSNRPTRAARRCSLEHFVADEDCVGGGYGQCVAAAAAGALACAAAVSSAAATWSLVAAPLPPPPLPPPAACWETMLGDLLMSAGCSVALCMLHSTRAVGERERWGAHEEHSHVARASTRLFLSRSRLDRNHSCTHSTLVLALVETFAWWTFGMFLALACERAGLCGR